MLIKIQDTAINANLIVNKQRQNEEAFTTGQADGGGDAGNAADQDESDAEEANDNDRR